MLHITDGQSVAGTLKESGVPGKVAIYGDLMFEGPAPAALDAQSWMETRARFMTSVGYAPLNETRKYLQDFQDTLDSYRQHEEIVIWLDPRLSDQLILIKVLDWFGRQDLGKVRLSLICDDHFAAVADFSGLGALTADQLASLLDTRAPVREAQLQTAQAAWSAFTSPDATAIETFLGTDTSALPFIAAALRRHLQQFPFRDNGLSRTERQALSILREHGTVPGPRLFVASQLKEEWVFMGDTQFYQLIANLAQAPHPLAKISDAAAQGLGEVRLTETGSKVLEGQSDHIDLNGIDRWLGGVYLRGDKAGFRWDSAAARIVNFS
jgi:hypothetical protein